METATPETSSCNELVLDPERYPYLPGSFNPLNPQTLFGFKNEALLRKQNPRKKSDEKTFAVELSIDPEDAKAQFDLDLNQNVMGNRIVNVKIIAERGPGNSTVDEKISLRSLLGYKPLFRYSQRFVKPLAVTSPPPVIIVPAICPLNDIPLIPIASSLHDLELATKPGELGTPIKLLAPESTRVLVVADYISKCDHKRSILVYDVEYHSDGDYEADINYNAYPYDKIQRNPLTRQALSFETAYLAITGNRVQDVAIKELITASGMQSEFIYVPAPVDQLPYVDDYLDDDKFITYGFSVNPIGKNPILITPTRHTKHTCLAIENEDGDYEDDILFDAIDTYPDDYGFYRILAVAEYGDQYPVVDLCDDDRLINDDLNGDYDLESETLLFLDKFCKASEDQNNNREWL